MVITAREEDIRKGRSERRGGKKIWRGVKRGEGERKRRKYGGEGEERGEERMRKEGRRG